MDNEQKVIQKLITTQEVRVEVQNQLVESFADENTSTLKTFVSQLVNKFMINAKPQVTYYTIPFTGQVYIYNINEWDSYFNSSDLTKSISISVWDSANNNYVSKTFTETDIPLFGKMSFLYLKNHAIVVDLITNEQDVLNPTHKNKLVVSLNYNLMKLNEFRNVLHTLKDTLSLSIDIATPVTKSSKVYIKHPKSAFAIDISEQHTLNVKKHITIAGGDTSSESPNIKLIEPQFGHTHPVDGATINSSTTGITLQDVKHTHKIPLSESAKPKSIYFELLSHPSDTIPNAAELSYPTILGQLINNPMNYINGFQVVTK